MKGRSRELLIAAGWLVSAALATHAASQEPRSHVPVLSLDEALSIALSGNRDLAHDALDLEAARDQVEAARTRRYPVLKLEVSASHSFTDQNYTVKAGQFGSFPATGPIPATDVPIHSAEDFTGMVVTQAALPLSRQYQIGLGIDAQEAGRKLAEEHLRARRQQIAYDVKKAYHEVVETQSALLAASDSVAYLRELVELVSRHERERTALAGDVLDARSRLASAEHDARALENALETRRETLNDLLGRDLSTAFDVVAASTADGEPFDGGDAGALALAHRPEIRSAALEIERADVAREIKRSEYIPELSAVVSYTRPVGIDFVPDEIAYAGLKLDWDVWDWGRKGHELAADERAAAQARNAEVDAKAKVVREARAALRAVEEARLALGAAELARDSAKERLRVAVDRYREHAGLLTDTLSAHAALTQADAQYQQAITNLWSVRANLERALGEE